MESNLQYETTKKKKTLSPHFRRKHIWAYIFILPQLLYFLFASLYPIVMSYVYSAYEWDGLGPLEQYVGLGNYLELLKDPMFWKTFNNSLVYGIGTTIISMFVSLILALILNGPNMKGKGFYRTLYFLPVVTTTSIIGIIMNNIFGIRGFFNEFLMTLGIIEQPIKFWLEPTLAMLLLIIIGSWKQIGVIMIYWLAGLQTISNDLYEAAKIDGAGYWKALWYITLPLLKPVTATILLITVSGSLKVFDLVKTLTNGGPNHETETLELYIYNYAFASDFGGARVGYASAAGVLLEIFVLFISLLFGWMVFKANGGRKRRV